MFGMSESQLQAFLERISATTIANQAILKCKSLDVPLTVENAIFFVGDFFDPSNAEFEPMIEAIHDAIVYVVERPDTGEGGDDGIHGDVVRLIR